MSTFILSLPADSGAATPEYDYALTHDGQNVALQGRAPLALLPAAPGRATEVVAVLPASAVSWHRLKVPERVARSLLSLRLDPARARAVLAGAMEEQLLDDPQALHFAVFSATGADAGVWVAVCARAWLTGAVQALEAAGWAVGRLVAECVPAGGAEQAQAILSTGAAGVQMALCTEQGVALLPLCAASVALARAQPTLQVMAEPGAMAAAEGAFGAVVMAQTLPQRLVTAQQSPWNLAQLELSPSKGGRVIKRLSGVWQVFMRSGEWRPVRLGLVALVLVQLVALNAMALRENALLAQKRQDLQAVLTQTFPTVQVVVDAPVQMQREVRLLAQSRGAADMNVAGVLTALGASFKGTKPITALDAAGGELRIKAPGAGESDLAGLAAALASSAVTVRWQGDQIVVQPEGGR